MRKTTTPTPEANQEYFLEIEGEKSRVGRVIISRHHDGFAAEVDIVQRESKKIWWHVTRIYRCCDEREALDEAVYSLTTFLKKRT